MKLKGGSEEEFEKWRLKMLATKRTDVFKGFLEISKLLDSNHSVEEVVEILAKVKLNTKVKLKDLGYLALAVSIFHEKGRSFRFNWNRFWQGEDWALDGEISGLERIFDPYSK